MRVEVVDGDREHVVGVHQPVRPGHDAVPIRIRVVGEGDVEFAAHGHQSGHGIGGRAIHPDATVPVGSHETERGIDRIADDGGGDAISLDNGLPKPDGCAAERVDADTDIRRADDVQVDNVGQVLDIRADEVMAMDMRGFQGAAERDAFDSVEARRQQRVGNPLDVARHVDVGRPAVGRIIFEAAILRWIVRRRDDDSVG